MEADFCPKQAVTILSTPQGLILSTGKGQFIIQSTVAQVQHEVDPVEILGMTADELELVTNQAEEAK